MRGKIIKRTLIGILICLGFITMNSLGNKKKVDERVLGLLDENKSIEETDKNNYKKENYSNENEELVGNYVVYDMIFTNNQDDKTKEQIENQYLGSYIRISKNEIEILGEKYPELKIDNKIETSIKEIYSEEIINLT